jgi:ATP-dependent DNA helicase PIF1
LLVTFVKKKKTKKKADLSFGGIQVILCGDFLQLPPVKHNRFLFQAKSWNSVIRHCYELKTVFRQKDPEFVQILHEVRQGSLSPESLQKLRSCKGKNLTSDDGIEPTTLYPIKHNVDRENSQRLEKLEGNLMIFKATDTAHFEKNLDLLKKGCPAKEELCLKVGAQVILLKNLDLDKELVNGARGTVTDFVEDSKSGFLCPVVKFRHTTKLIRAERWALTMAGAEVAAREQIPLDLAWAMSIHKSQGMTIDKLRVHLGGAFACGQVYVALSRASSLEGLSIADEIKEENIFSDPAVLKFYSNLRSLI